jgi:hypothetical protein
LAEHGRRIGVQAELKAIEKEADDEARLIDQRSPKIMIMMQRICF